MKVSSYSLELFLGLGLIISAVTASDLDEAGVNSRKGKVVSLFNIVSFENQACKSTSSISSSGTGSTRRNGTCFTKDECISKGGSPAGNCASGFGVCCVFLIDKSGTEINQNCSYIRNPGYPTAFMQTTGVQHTIRKCASNVCRLRLDFEAFTLKGTGFTTEVTPTDMLPAGGECLDRFTVTSTSGQRVPVICGQNTGHHIYVDMGSGDSDTVALAFNFDATNVGTVSRQWEIKVSQLPCDAHGPPAGCLQWHTGITGRLTTFNFIPTNDNHLNNQDYSICIRQERGYCCVEYSVCADQTSSFSLGIIAAAGMAKQDSLCTQDYIRIEGGSAVCTDTHAPVGSQKYCGQFLSNINEFITDHIVCDCTAPFIVDIVSDAFSDEDGIMTANTLHSRGICLDYNQIPCQ